MFFHKNIKFSRQKAISTITLDCHLTLLRMNESHEFCVLEVGCNHFEEIKYLCEIAEPDFGMITNIGKEHLEFFKDLKGVAKAEFELFDYLNNKERRNYFY